MKHALSLFICATLYLIRSALYIFVKTRLESVRQRKKGDVSVFCFFKKKGKIKKERKKMEMEKLISVFILR